MAAPRLGLSLATTIHNSRKETLTEGVSGAVGGAESIDATPDTLPALALRYTMVPTGGT